ncbi:Mur ligase [Cokeromyces recurvatus]|uniref:Mur ligase n=1 Tax=Cokeromyces recurvatus TaxID=90255 RepID=UPI00221F6E0C|nr:Mur ligase [Cokeromyces recurvatus]KAI7901950.1 Mur ligase [Cokeromyces recurvatus]
MSKRKFTYNEAVEKLNSLQSNAALLEQLRKAGPRASEKSLPEMKEHFRRIGYEPKDFDKLNLIHVTGTKGKGSTSALTQSILHHYDSNIKTGLFTSPHLVAVRERIRINGEPISEELFSRYFQDVWERLEATKEEAIRALNLSEQDTQALLRNKREHPDKPVYFRFLTLVALHAFIQEKVDCAILEVGIGGEYDSTNIIEKPIVCGITALGLDHVSILGNTIDQIAWHKAGIIKPGVPVISFKQVPEAMEVVKKRAQEKNAPLTIVHAKDICKLDDIKLGLAGIHQKYNALTAIEICKIWLKKIRGIQFDNNEQVPKEFRQGLAMVKWPGRCQELPIKETKYGSNNNNNVTWYLDGAHTIESLQVCAAWFKDIAEHNSKALRILVFNCTHGRDSSKLLRVISEIQPQVHFDHVVFTTNVTFKEGYTADNTNRTDSREEITSVQQVLAKSWLEQVPEFYKDCVHVVETIEDTVQFAINRSNNLPNDKEQVQILTTGSLIMVGNMLTVLGIQPQ